MKVACGAFCLMCLVFYASVADAMLITKRLHDVSFADGGKATGSLILDTNSERITDFDITTTFGNSIPSSFHYLSETARITQESNEPGGSGWPFSFLQINAEADESAGGRQLFLAFDGPVDADTATSILDGNTLGQVSYELEIEGQHLQRQRLISGDASIVSSPIPEPATIACLGFGLSLVWVLRRRATTSYASARKKVSRLRSWRRARYREVLWRTNFCGR